MKKVINTLLIAGAVFISYTAGAQKMAHINLDSLLRSMPESDSARKVGQAHYTMLENTIEAMQKEYQQKVTDYQKAGPGMTEIVKQTKQQEIQDLGQRIQSFQTSAQTDLQRFNDSITRPIITKARKAVNEVAKAGGYRYVFDTSSGVVLYGDPSDDIYAMVANKLGIKPKK